jgi:MFS family permease
MPEGRLGGAIGALTGGFGIGTALGLGLGGVIAGLVSWRLIFALGGAAIIVGMVLVALFVPPSPRGGEAGLDLAGGALFGGSLAALLLAMTEGVSLGWTSGTVIGLFIAAFALMAGWVVRELRTESPLIDLRIFGSPVVLLTNLATITLGYALFGIYFLIPQLVESPGAHHGLSTGAVGAGLFLVPAAIGQLVAGPLSGVIGRRLPTKWVFTGGMLLTSAGAALLAAWHEEPWQIAPEMLVLGLGMGFGVSAAGSLVTRAVSEKDTGISNAVNSVLRRVGGGIGGQVGAALLAAFTASGGPAQIAFVAAFAASAALCLLGAGFAVFVPERAG